MGARPTDDDDPDLEPDLRSLRDSVRRFLATEVGPTVADFERRGEFDWTLPARLREFGMLGGFLPESQGGVDLSHVQWVPFDGIGREARVGLNFTERGFGVRPALGCSDRGHTAASQMKPGDIDWKRVREELNKIGFRSWATAEVKGGDRQRLADISAQMDAVLR